MSSKGFGFRPQDMRDFFLANPRKTGAGMPKMSAKLSQRASDSFLSYLLCPLSFDQTKEDGNSYYTFS
jgi:hypothetical protein